MPGRLTDDCCALDRLLCGCVSCDCCAAATAAAAASCILIKLAHDDCQLNRHICVLHSLLQAVVHVKKGVEQLKDAEKFQKSARPIKCMVILMILIVIMTIIIIVKKS